MAMALALGAGALSHSASSATADSSYWITFAPDYGGAGQIRTVQFAGFAESETLDITFYDPSHNQVMVGASDTFYASAESDGAGTFPFRPADWFDHPASGWWFAHAIGATSGLTYYTTFLISDN